MEARLLGGAALGARSGELLKAAQETKDEVRAALEDPSGELLKAALETEDRVRAALGAPSREAALGAPDGELLKAAFETKDKAKAKILEGPHEDLENNLETIKKLRTSIQFVGSKMGIKGRHGKKDEFKQLLSCYSKPVEAECLFDWLQNSMQSSSGSPGHEGDPSGKNPSSNHHSEPHNNNNNNADAVVCTPPALIPPRILPLLNDLAQQMVGAGHEQQLLETYRYARSSVLEESLQKFGVEKLNNDDVQKLQREILEAKVGNWIHVMRIAVKLLFAGERRVCDQIFKGFDSLSEQCFAVVTANSVYMLLSFGVAITKSKRSSEWLFLLLDMHELMRELHSEIETLFKGDACSKIREAEIDLTKRLAKTALETIGEFEEAIKKDATKTAVTDGSVHPLTSHVFNYVKSLSVYQSILKQILGGDDSSRLASVTMRIMQALQTNLNGKSMQYRDPALRHLFLMNNILYIVRSVQRSEAEYLLGDDWVRQHMGIVGQHAIQYKRNAWAETLQCLSIQGLSSSGGWTRISSAASTAFVKDRFKTFNDMFEELHRKQSQWTVTDREVRVDLQLAVAQVLLPAYRSFVGRFGHLVESRKNSQKYIKYTAEDLDRMLGELFEGKNMTKASGKRVAD